MQCKKIQLVSTLLVALADSFNWSTVYSHHIHPRSSLFAITFREQYHYFCTWDFCFANRSPVLHLPVCRIGVVADRFVRKQDYCAFLKTIIMQRSIVCIRETDKTMTADGLSSGYSPPRAPISCKTIAGRVLIVYSDLIILMIIVCYCHLPLKYLLGHNLCASWRSTRSIRCFICNLYFIIWTRFAEFSDLIYDRIGTKHDHVRI